MLRLIIKFILIFLLISYIYLNPIPVACFCSSNSWWSRCIQGTEESSVMCREIDFVINNINDALKFISDNLKTVFNTLSKDIPLIPTDIPKVAELVESKYTNYEITFIPQIQNISLSCPITIPLSTISTQVNNATTDINTQLSNVINKIYTNQFTKDIVNIMNILIEIKNNIDLINFKKIINIDNILDIINNKILNILKIVEEEAKKIIQAAKEEAEKIINQFKYILERINELEYYINHVTSQTINELVLRLDFYKGELQKTVLRIPNIINNISKVTEENIITNFNNVNTKVITVSNSIKNTLTNFTENEVKDIISQLNYIADGLNRLLNELKNVVSPINLDGIRYSIKFYTERADYLKDSINNKINYVSNESKQKVNDSYNKIKDTAIIVKDKVDIALNNVRAGLDSLGRIIEGSVWDPIVNKWVPTVVDIGKIAGGWVEDRARDAGSWFENTFRF